MAMSEPIREMPQAAARRALARELVRTELENPGANVVDSPDALSRIYRLLLAIDLHQGASLPLALHQELRSARHHVVDQWPPGAELTNHVLHALDAHSGLHEG